MTMSLASSLRSRIIERCIPSLHQHTSAGRCWNVKNNQLFQQQSRWRHVRVIALKDFPNGKASEGDVIDVKAGYARNYLYPKKYVVYATRDNFLKLNMEDPFAESSRERRLRLARAAVQRATPQSTDLREAERLRKYLSNKMVTIYRVVPDEDSNIIPPDRYGVTPKIVKEKLSKQLKIDLLPHEPVYIREEPVESFEEFEKQLMLEPIDDDDDDDDDDETSEGDTSDDEDVKSAKEKEGSDGGGGIRKPRGKSDSRETSLSQRMDRMLRKLGDKEKISPILRRLGNYYVRIWLKGDYVVPLKLRVVRRW